jgi:hypothetical protein
MDLYFSNGQAHPIATLPPLSLRVWLSDAPCSDPFGGAGQRGGDRRCVALTVSMALLRVSLRAAGSVSTRCRRADTAVTSSASERRHDDQPLADLAVAFAQLGDALIELAGEAGEVALLPVLAGDPELSAVDANVHLRHDDLVCGSMFVGVEHGADARDGDIEPARDLAIGGFERPRARDRGIEI